MNKLHFGHHHCETQRDTGFDHNHQAACLCVVCSEELKACMLGSFLAELLESDASSQ
jgi:hypothetical protein